MINDRLTSSGVHCPFVERLVGPVVLLNVPQKNTQKNLVYVFQQTNRAANTSVKQQYMNIYVVQCKSQFEHK